MNSKGKCYAYLVPQSSETSNAELMLDRFKITLKSNQL